MKLKTGWGVAEDVRLTRALREEIGGEVELMVDANHAYDPSTRWLTCARSRSST